MVFFFFSSRRRHTRSYDDWSSDVCSSDLSFHKGTGYYKVPSLKGVWYRGPFEHNGSVATLEDWFDPARLRADYVPTGFKGRSEERRVGKECRAGAWADDEKKKEAEGRGQH